jgi:HK97 family phage major capsid protein
MRISKYLLLKQMHRRLGITVGVRNDAPRTSRMSVQAIRERMGEIHDQATALTNLAESEDRDLTDEEKGEFDNHMATYNRLKDTELPRAEWLEAEEARLAEQRIQNRINTGDHNGRGGQPLDTPGTPEGAPRASRITIPARARSGRQLKAFAGGQDAEREAYLSGQWLLANIWGHDGATAWCREHGIHVRGAMAGSEGNLGGHLIPEEFERSIIRLVEDYGVFRRFARVIPMGSDTWTGPRRIGGVTVYFPGENGSITESDPTVDQITLTARKMAALVKYSTEISEDAVIDIADFIATEIAYGFAVKEDACGFLGTGTSTYGGVSGLITETGAGSTVTAASGNTAFSTLDLTDFESMVGKLPRYPGIRPRWFISQAGWAASMMRLQDAAGGNSSQDLGSGPGMTFLGFPVVIVQSMNSTLTAQTSTDGLCYFGDLALAASFGMRRGIRINVSEDRYFEYDQIGIKGTERFDINVHDAGDASNAGAIVMLATPGS